MIRFFITAILAMACVAGYSQKKKSTKPATLFTINGEAITADEFIYLYKKNHQNKEDFTDQKINEYLDLFLNFKLKVTEARNRGYDKTPEFIKEYNSYKDELRKPYLPEGKILDSLVKLTYERLKYELNVSHILINLKPDASPADTLEAYTRANDLKKRAETGEDFSSLAALYSEEPGAQTSKGNLGHFTALQMVYPFEQAAYSGKVGDVVGPVRTRFGYHVLKITDKRPSRGEVEVSHIMIRVNGQENEAKSKNRIFEIHDKLGGGMKWEELCKQYSEDPGSKDNGGKLRVFGVRDLFSIPEFDQVAFALKNPGDISDPFRTTYGWHIVRLERKIPLPPFDEAAVALKSKVARDERVQISKRSLMAKLKSDFSFTENASVKAKVMQLPDSSLTKGKWKIPASFSSGKETLFTVQSKKITAQNFLEYVQQNQRPNSMRKAQYMEMLYTNFSDVAMNEALEAKIIKSNPDFEILLREYYEGILLFDIMEKQIWKKASEDSAGQRSFFDSNPGKYQAKDRIMGVIYSADSKDKLELLQKNLVSKDSAAAEKTIEEKNIRQETGRFQLEDRTVFSKIDWKPGLYLRESNAVYYLIDVKGTLAPGPMSFEEARSSLISDFQNDMEKNWLILLRKKYPVKVNSKTKAYVIEKLKS